MNTSVDPRIIMTLDAGGTNLVFSAIRANKEIIRPIQIPSVPDKLSEILETIMDGFNQVQKQIPGPATAISFAFPGPADYPAGIIGDLPNFEAFTGDVPLGPILEEVFRIPVYINNDGDLFAYGEAIAGFLPAVNRKLREAGSPKQFRNLIGFTLGTGFGGGIVTDQKMLIGNNSCGAEIHNSLNLMHPEWNAEESVSTRAIQRVYFTSAGLEFNPSLLPEEIYRIATGERKDGNREAAMHSFEEFGKNLGSSICNAMTLIDGLVVLGGGLTGAWNLFSGAMFEEINRPYSDFKGKTLPRLSYKVFNLEDEDCFSLFAEGNVKEIQVPGTSRLVTYDQLQRSGVGLSSLGANRAIATGAYAFALNRLNLQENE